VLLILVNHFHLLSHNLHLLIDQNRLVLPDHIPLTLNVRRRLARNDDMITMIFDLPQHTMRMLIAHLRWGGELAVERNTRCRRDVQTRGLVKPALYVPESHSKELLSVSRAEVERAALVSRVSRLLGGGERSLEFEDGVDRCLQRGFHLGEGVSTLPVVVVRAREVSQVQRREVFGVTGTPDRGEGFIGELLAQLAADFGEGGDGTVVHEDVSSKCERMIVEWLDSGGGHADVGEDGKRRSVLGERAEVRIVDWRLNDLVDGGALS